MFTPTEEQIQARILAWREGTQKLYGFNVFWEDVFYLTLKVAEKKGAQTYADVMAAFKSHWPKQVSEITDMVEKYANAKGHVERIEHHNRMWCTEAEFRRRANLPDKIRQPEKMGESTPARERALSDIDRLVGKGTRIPAETAPVRVEGFTTPLAPVIDDPDIEARREAGKAKFQEDYRALFAEDTEFEGLAGIEGGHGDTTA